MPAPFDLPGYYWDDERGKFFKIEGTGTAPSGARWSLEQVNQQERRQRLIDRRRRPEPAPVHPHFQPRQSENRQDRQDSRVQRPFKRTRLLRNPEAKSASNQSPPSSSSSSAALWGPRGPVHRFEDTHPILDCETGGARTCSATVNDGRLFGRSLAATAASVYARNLRHKGATPVLDEDFSLKLEYTNAIMTRPSSRVELPNDGNGAFPMALTQPKVVSSTRISCMYVHSGDGPPGMGVVYTNYSTQQNTGDIKGQYIIVGEDESVADSWPTRPPYSKYAGHERTRPECINVPDASAICYHESSRNLIVTSRQLPSPFIGRVPYIHIFSPYSADDLGDSDSVTWQIGNRISANASKPIYKIFGAGPLDAVYACVASPRGFNSLCVVGAGCGLAAIDLEVVKSAKTLSTGYAGPVGESKYFHRNGGPVAAPSGLRKGLTLAGHGVSTPSRLRNKHSDSNIVTTVDFLDNHPGLVLAGGRWSDPWLVDLREPVRTTWRRFGGGGVVTQDEDGLASQSRGANAVAHVRSAGGYRVVAASLRDTMLLYDLRYLRSEGSAVSGRGKGHGAQGRDFGSAAEPLFRFSNYYNDARLIGLGFAVDASLGVVAVGEEHAAYTGLGGGVSLFSLSTGERLSTPGLSQISHSADTIVRTYSPSAQAGGRTFSSHTGDRKEVSNSSTARMPRITALSFASLPGEGPSLFAGDGPYVHKFSLGTGREDIFFSEDGDEERRGKGRS